MRAKDPDHATRDLHEAIKRGDYPSWTLQMQIMTPEQADDYRFDIFDVTKVWPHADFPPIEVGKMVLNRNPENYFAEVEQAAFGPGNLVPGIAASPDKMLQGRLFSPSSQTGTELSPAAGKCIKKCKREQLSA